MEDTNDYFHGRKGAHHDLIVATDRLIDSEVVPRWQVYLNKLGIKELHEVLALADELNLWDRVQDLGETLNIHAMTFDSAGNGFANHHLRLTAGDEQFIPSLLWEKTKNHFGDDCRLFTEAELVASIMDEGEGVCPMPKDHNLVFFLTSDWNVYPNFSEVAPWWKLGNLKTDPWGESLARYESSRPLGLRVMTTSTHRELHPSDDEDY